MPPLANRVEVRTAVALPLAMMCVAKGRHFPFHSMIANQRWLDSLLFGADLALEKGDFSSVQVQALKLIGFLSSRSHSQVDEAFIRPIRLDAHWFLILANYSPSSPHFSSSWFHVNCLPNKGLVRLPPLTLPLKTCSFHLDEFETEIEEPVEGVMWVERKREFIVA
ncbi:unnamed protein product [Fraxinus pennsylvanica]|uniref:FIGL1 N-terminal domain-containing protein n=1 Tax=Fraxinus pennsylvanica TaxID=56036 RepID=A0AAD2A290_9LAMI|nr:unnamed protein product [Fraxinus pennsylvanica]